MFPQCFHIFSTFQQFASANWAKKKFSTFQQSFNMLNVENFASFLSIYGRKKSFQQFQQPLLLLLSKIRLFFSKQKISISAVKVTNCNFLLFSISAQKYFQNQKE